MSLGKIGVRVYPDTRGLQKELKTVLERVERSVQGKVQIKPVLDREALNRLRSSLQSLSAKVRVDMDTSALAAAKSRAEKEFNSIKSHVDINADLDTGYFKAQLAKAQQAAHAANLNIPATMDGERIRSDLDRMLAQLKSQVRGAKIPVGVEQSAAFRASIANMVRRIESTAATINADADTARAQHKLDKLTDKKDMTVNADADTGLASLRLKLLTHMRTVDIVPTVNAGAFAAAQATLATLSGGRVLSDLGSGVKNVVTNMDRLTPSVSKAVLAIGTITPLMGALTSNIFSAGSALVAMAPAAIALPGLMLGAGAGITALSLALKDTKQYLGDLGPAFADIQKSVSGAFWTDAAAPIREMVTTLLPTLKTGLTEISFQFTDWARAISTAVTQSTPQISSLFQSVADAVNISGEGVGNFTQGIINIGAVGAQYLPAIADAFNGFAEKFREWSESAAAADAISSAINVAKELGGVLTQVVGILGAVASAANEAGGTSLGALTDALRNVNAAISDGAGRDALVGFFKASHAAVEALGPGLGALGRAFISLLPTINNAMVKIAGAVSELAKGIGEALSDPAVASGLKDLVQGVVDGVKALAGAIPSVAPVVGELARTFGQMAATLGPVIGETLKAAAPVFTSLLQAIQPLIPVVGGALVTAIQAIAPVITPIIQAIADWVRQNPELTATIIAVVAVVGTLISILISIVTAIAPVVTAVAALVAAFGVPFVAIGAAIAAVVIAVIALITGLVVFLVTNWETISQATIEIWTAITQFMMDVWNGVANFLTEVITNIVNFLTTAWTGIVDTVTTVFTTVSQVITDVWTGIVEFLTTIWTQITEAVVNFMTPIVEAFQTGWNKLVEIVTAVGQGILIAIVAVGILIYEGIVAIVTPIVNFWTTAWNGFVNIVTDVWNNVVAMTQAILGPIVDFINQVWNNIVAGVQAFLTPIIQWVGQTWDNVTRTIRIALETAAAYVNAKWHEIQAIISSVLSAIGSWVSSKWNEMVSIISGALGQISSWVSSKWHEIVSVISGKVNEAVSTVTGMGSRIFSAVSGWVGEMVGHGRNLMQGFINGVQQMAQNIVNAVTGPINDAVGKAKNILGIHSPSRVFRQFGVYTGQGYIQGMRKMRDPVRENMAKLMAPPPSPKTPYPPAYAGTGGVYSPEGKHGPQGYTPGGGLTVNVTGQEEMSPDRFGRRVGEALAYQLAQGGVNV
nr:MAG TPA: Minor tail protein [Caudoviricetes sp.]